MTAPTATTAQARLLEEIDAAVAGPTTAAFVDVDGTLLAGCSLAPLLAPRDRIGGFVHRLRTAVSGPDPDPAVDRVEALLATWVGRDAEELADEGRRTFRDVTAGWLRPEVWRLLRAHHRRGHTVVLVSRSTRFQLDPMALEIEADAVLGTDVTVADGSVTGPTGPVLAGALVPGAVRELAARRTIDLTASFAYGDAEGDLPLLDLVGHPVAVAPSAAVRDRAVAADRPVVECAARGASPDAADLAGTAGFYAGFTATAGAAVGVGLLRGSRQRAWNLACSTAAEVSLALAGVDVEVTGAEHLWSARPAVFVFNHQSLLDPIVVMKMLRHDFTGVAKKEARGTPVFGQLFVLADVAFVDREDNAAAREALAPAVAKLRDGGVSLAMAPEGTRSPTPRPGRFKKGPSTSRCRPGCRWCPSCWRTSAR